LETLLAASSLRLRQGERLLFENISLEILPGQIWALSGPSGAGKTSLLRCLSGEISHEGSVDRNSALAEIPQSLALNDELPAWENVATARFLNQKKVSPFFSLMPTPALWRNQSSTCLRSLGISAPERKTGQLSGGERQRVAVARALLADWKILLADEPVSQLDLANSRLVLSALVQATKERKGALLLVIHHESLAREFATHFLELGVLA
jgi:ABC-type phosphate/phosphonate transport system ATPase subunit